MAAKTFYFQDVRSGGWETIDESPVTAATSATGWTVGTGNTNSSELAAATERAATTFVNNTVPDGTLDTSLKDALRSTNAITGSFAAGNWSLIFVVRGSTSAANQQGRMVVRLIKADSDGSNATQITTGQQTASICSAVANTTTDYTSSLTFNPGAFSLNGQYLFIQIAWKRTAAGGDANADILLRTGSDASTGTRIVTTTFITPPAAYLDITTSPYSRTVTQAEFNGGTYGNDVNQVWFRYVCAANEIFGTYTNKGGTFTPRVRLYAGSAMALVRGVSNNISFWAQLTSGTTYYIEVVKTDLSASDFDFTTQSDVATLLSSVPAGAVVINDDSAGFAAAVYQTDGTFLGYLDTMPGGEIGDSLPDGTALLHDRFGKYGSNPLALFSPTTYAHTTSVDTSPAIGAVFPSITNDGTQFWVVKRGAFPSPVFTISASGTVSSTIASLSPNNRVEAAGVSPDGTIMYWAEGMTANSTYIHRHDLTSDTPLSDLYGPPALVGGASGYIALTAVNNHPGEILVLSDGSIVTWYHNYDTTPDEDVLLHISAAGSLLHSYTYTTQQIDHIAYAPDSPTGIHIWFFLSTPGSSDDTRGRIGHLDLATGTLTASFDHDLFSAGVNKVSASTTLFGPSASCTMFTAEYLAATGTIVVTKVTQPSTSPGDTTVFAFTSTALGSPASFSLSDGESQTFADVAAGSGYGIAEMLLPWWTTTYTVSNGSPINNLTVSAGETVTVTVTNTYTPASYPDACPPCTTDTSTVPDVVGPLPPWTATCADGGVVDSVADLTDGEDWRL